MLLYSHIPAIAPNSPPKRLLMNPPPPPPPPYPPPPYPPPPPPPVRARISPMTSHTPSRMHSPRQIQPPMLIPPALGFLATVGLDPSRLTTLVPFRSFTTYSVPRSSPASRIAVRSSACLWPPSRIASSKILCSARVFSCENPRFFDSTSALTW